MSVLDEASLVQIPSGYKISKLYSVVPTSGAGDLSFARSTTATRVNESGVIETVAINVPRIDYTGGGCGQLLLEPQRTNLYTYSDDFTNATWSKHNTLASSSAVNSPIDGGTADFIVATAVSDRHWIQQSISASASTDYSFSFYVKSGGSDFIQVALSTGFAGTYQNFNVSTGTKGSGNLGASGYSSTIEAFGDDGYYKIVLYTTTSVGASSANVYIDPILTDAGRLSTYLGDGVNGVYCSAIQLEQGSYPTSYIPTSGTSVTRTADASSTSGLSSVIGSEEGLILLDAQAFINGGSNRYFTIGDGTYQNYISMFYHNSVNRLDTIAVKAGSVLTLKNIFSFTQSDRNIIAIRYKTDSYDLWVNGASQGIVTGMGAFFAANLLTNVQLTNTIGNNPMEGDVNVMLLMKTYPTDTQMADLTTL